MPYEVFLTDRAQRDLDTARAYIAQHAPDIAERWYLSFLESLLDLEENPAGRPLAPEDTAFPFDLHQFIYRAKGGKANRALFTVVGDQVRILAIRRPGQPLMTRADIK